MLSLGVAGRWAALHDELNISTSWIGGSLCHIPGVVEQLGTQRLVCRICEQALTLVAQIHAPRDADSTGQLSGTRQRWLLLLGCTAARCGRAPGSWRAFRIQQQHSKAQHASIQPSKDQCMGLGNNTTPQTSAGQSAQTRGSSQRKTIPESDASSPHAKYVSGTNQSVLEEQHCPSSTGDPCTGATQTCTTHSFDFGSTRGFDIGNSFALPKPRCERDDSMNFGALDEALSSAVAGPKLTVPSPTKTLKQQRRIRSQPREVQTPHEHDDTKTAAARDTAICTSTGPSLPKFYLNWTYEPSAVTGKGVESDEQHIADLLDQYRASHDMIETGSEVWAGETYERAQLLGGDQAFPRFQKRLARSPAQCLRHSPDGSVLWPAEHEPAAEPCGRCGAVRTCELQIMPALHHAINEGLSWQGSEQQARGHHGQQHPPQNDQLTNKATSIDSWLWLTAAVMTCSASCCAGDSDDSVFEEAVCLFNEV